MVDFEKTQDRSIIMTPPAKVARIDMVEWNNMWREHGATKRLSKVVDRALEGVEDRDQYDAYVKVRDEEIEMVVGIWLVKKLPIDDDDEEV